MPRQKNQNKAGKSIMRNYAGEETKNAFKLSCNFFYKSYLTFKKQHGEICECDEDKFNDFISSVNGVFKMRMRQIRKEYQSSVTDKKMKQENQWNVLINTMKNGYSEKNEKKIQCVIYHINNYR